jgi:hypothetical protein
MPVKSGSKGTSRVKCARGRSGGSSLAACASWETIELAHCKAETNLKVVVVVVAKKAIPSYLSRTCEEWMLGHSQAILAVGSIMETDELSWVLQSRERDEVCFLQDQLLSLVIGFAAFIAGWFVCIPFDIGIVEVVVRVLVVLDELIDVLVVEEGHLDVVVSVNPDSMLDGSGLVYVHIVVVVVEWRLFFVFTVDQGIGHVMAVLVSFSIRQCLSFLFHCCSLGACGGGRCFLLNGSGDT